MEIRDAGKADLPAMLALTHARTPDYGPWWVTTLFEDGIEIDCAPLAFEGDLLLGYGSTSHRRGAPEHQRAVQVFVAADAAGRGVGRALLDRCVEEADARTTELWTKVHDDDPVALGIAQHWGFEIVQRSISSRIELTGPGVSVAPPTPPEGVILEECGALDFEGADGEAFDAMLRASQTNPEASTSHVFTREEMAHWVDPSEQPVAALARVDGCPAAIAFAIVAPEHGEGGVAYTGVDPAYRGRALGRLVKEHVHHQAAQLGMARLTTDNEENNAGIRHVNEQLGYVKAYGVYRLRRQLGS